MSNTEEKTTLSGEPVAHHKFDFVKTSDANWNLPLRWNRAAEKAGERHRVFSASLADVFEDRPELHAPRARLFDLIRQTPNLDWLLLTKRPENIMPAIDGACRIACEHGDEGNASWIGDWLDGTPPANVWLGTSVENQKAADERIPHLLEAPAVCQFLSCEPLLGPVVMRGPWLRPACGCGSCAYKETGFPCSNPKPFVRWMIAGGESGPNARPMHPAWPRGLRDQCAASGVPFLFKQWGEWAPKHNDDSRYGEFHVNGEWVESCLCSEGTEDLYRVGKRAAGRRLDGVLHNQFPKVNQ